MLEESLVAVRCALCGGEGRETVASAHEVRAHLAYLRRFHARRLRVASRDALCERADFTHDYATDVVRCSDCGLIYRSPRPSPAAIARAYAQDTYGHQRLASLFDAQCALYRPKAAALRRYLAPGSRVVEVGSFVGGFLVAGKELGWKMQGVDPGHEVDAFCAERGLGVFPGTLSDFAAVDGRAHWEAGTVDCVAVWNAFDQLPDPQPTLAAARRLLRPGGLLVLRVPNGECFALGQAWSRRLRAPWSGMLRALLAWNNLLAFPYLHGYSVRTLELLLSWHGFVRERAVPDTLCRLADEHTRWWAVAEEAVLKRICRVVARCDSWLPGSRLALAPWLDLYFRLPVA